MLILPDNLAAAIARHAAACYPEEACGILLGTIDAADPAAAHVTAARAAPNLAPKRQRRRRYLLAPRAQLAAQRDARAAGLELVGYYHSHPDHPALPSATDRRRAWPHTIYLIIPTTRHGAGHPRAWRLHHGILVELAMTGQGDKVAS